MKRGIYRRGDSSESLTESLGVGVGSIEFVSGTVSWRERKEREKERERGPVRGAAGLVLGRQWLARVTAPLFFLTKPFLLFLFYVFKTEFKTRPNLSRKFCKNTFQRA